MIVLNIITPVSRPANIPKISESIKAAMVPEIQIEWWLVYDASALPSELPQTTCHFMAVASIVDGKTVSVAGNGQRNSAIDKITDGWVYFLDDDTTLHPRLIKAVAPMLSGIPGCNIAFNQDWPDGKPRCTISPSHMHQGTVDTGQVVLARSAIGVLRESAALYHSDGPFIEAVFRAHPSSFIFLNETLSVYNSLR